MAQEWNIIQLGCQWLLILELSDPVISYRARRFKHQMSQKWCASAREREKNSDSQNMRCLDSSLWQHQDRCHSCQRHRMAGEDSSCWPALDVISEKIPREKNWQPATLNSCPFAFPELPFASPKRTTEICKFFPKVLLITAPPCRAQSAPKYGHYLGIPAPHSLVFLITCSHFFEGTVKNFTEMAYLQERGLICCCSSSRKDIRHCSLQLFQAADRMRPQSCLPRW